MRTVGYHRTRVRNAFTLVLARQVHGAIGYEYYEYQSIFIGLGFEIYLHTWNGTRDIGQASAWCRVNK